MLLAVIDEKTKVPLQMEKFWNSSSNKVLLQNFMKHKLISKCKEENVLLVVSGTITNEDSNPAEAVIGENVEVLDELNLRIEEADWRIIPHVKWALQNGNVDQFCIYSNDTDVVVLILGLQKIWIRLGIGSPKRLLPVHILHKNMPLQLLEVLLASYIGTGCDILSKVGSKAGALNTIPEMYLMNFGKTQLTKDATDLCEAYLVKVWQHGSDSRTFDNLRCAEYKKRASLIKLPPTSHSIRHSHIPRWWYIVSELHSLIDSNYKPKDPTKYGWNEEEGKLLPCKHLHALDKRYFSVCGCKSNDQTKCSSRCSCVKASISCTSFCSCSNHCSRSEKRKSSIGGNTGKKTRIK